MVFIFSQNWTIIGAVGAKVGFVTPEIPPPASRLLNKEKNSKSVIKISIHLSELPIFAYFSYERLTKVQRQSQNFKRSKTIQMLLLSYFLLRKYKKSFSGSYFKSLLYLLQGSWEQRHLQTGWTCLQKDDLDF